MTKKVRIENADNSQYGLWAILEERANSTAEWREIDRKPLFYPTDLVEIYIHSDRRILIEERKIEVNNG